MWGLNRFQRPPWSTGTLIPASFLCGITAAIFIWRGVQKTKRTKEVEERLRLALTMDPSRLYGDDDDGYGYNDTFLSPDGGGQGSNRPRSWVDTTTSPGGKRLTVANPTVNASEPSSRREKGGESFDENAIDEHMTIPSKEEQ